MFPFLILIELFYSYSFIVTAAYKLPPPRPPSAFDLHCLANRLSQVLALPLKVWDRKYWGKEQGKERTPVLLSPSEVTWMVPTVTQRRNNDANINALGRGVSIMRYNQAQEVALVTEDKLSKPVAAIFYPQVRDMHVWSLLQIKPPPHQWNKDIS